MKKTFNFLALITLVAMVVVGCKKSPHDNEEVVPGAGTAVLYASTESYEADTRVHLEDNNGTGETVRQISTTWRNDAESIDKITIYNEAGNRVGDLTYEGEDNATSGKFSGDVELKAGDSYTAVYPSSDALTLTARNAEALDFAEQTQASQIAIINDAVRMKAEFEYASENTTIAFENEMTIVSIDIAGQPNNKPQTLTFSNGSEDEYVINYSADAVSANSAIRTYIAVRPVSSTEERKLNFNLVYTNGLEWEFETTTTRAYAAGMLYTMPVEKSQILYITTVEELAAFRDDVNAGHDYEGRTVVLTKDITLSGEWTPIGSFDKTRIPFKGTFDGGNCTISGLTITDATTSTQGLFGFASGATIKNVKISEPQISSNADNVGALLGTGEPSTVIENCAVIGGSVSGNNDVGGVVGYNEQGHIGSCSNSSSVSGNKYVGGIVGSVNFTNTGYRSLKGNYNTGAINGEEYVGGVVGSMGEGGSTESDMESCYNTGTVTGTTNVGGVAGDSSDTVISCYNVGEVTGTTNVGGVVGQVTKGTVTNCFYFTGSATIGVGNGNGSAIEIITVQGLNDLVGATNGLPSADFTVGSPEATHLPQLMGENIEWENPKFMIADAAALVKFAYLVNTGNTFEGITVQLVDDIDLEAGYEWIPINGFSGTFNGGNKTISGLIISNATTDYQGFFGTASNLTIKNLVIYEPQISSSANFVGALIGSGHGSTIENCAVIGGSVSGVDYVGGIVGDGAAYTIKNCYNTASVSGNDVVGGVAGGVSDVEAKAYYCYNTGSVSGNNYVGGIGGYGSTISCYNTGSVTGIANVGGIAGNVYYSVTSSYNVGKVIGTSNAGSVVGSIESGSVTNSYYHASSYSTAIGNSKSGTTATNVTEVLTVQGLNDLVGATNGLPSTDFTVGSPELTHLPRLMGENIEWEESVVPDLVIKNEEELRNFRDRVNSGVTFEGVIILLESDITITESNWIPIAYSDGLIDDSDPRFKGTFDGGGHKISGLTIYSKRDGDYNLALFGLVKDAVIRNVIIESPQIYSENYAATAIAGYVENSVIEHCGVLGGSIESVGYSGGLIAGAVSTTIRSCFNSATIVGSGEQSGGIVGTMQGGELSSCYNAGVLMSNCSGIAYSLTQGATISDSYNAGEILEGGSAIVYDKTFGSTENCFYLKGSTEGSSEYQEVESVQALNDLVGAPNGLPISDFAIGRGSSNHLPQLMGENIEFSNYVF